MLVSFKFECMKHGEFEHYFNTVQYPDRDFPLLTVMCPEEECNRLASYIPASNMSPDPYWSGKSIEALGLPNVTSRDYLRRFLKNNNLAQLTSDEVEGHRGSQKTKKQKVEEVIKKNNKAREEAINSALEKHNIT